MGSRKRSIYPRIMLKNLSYIIPAWENTSSIQVGLVTSTIVISLLLLWKLFKKTQRYELPARDISKGHRWCSIEIFCNTAYCNICSSLIVDGFYCDSCGLCADHSCLKNADKTINCKSLAVSGISMKHHWVKGNLPTVCICDICEAECGTEAGLTDFRCCWCQRAVHTNCLPKMSEVCDFGRFRSFIVPPFCVRLKLVGLKGRRHLIVGEVRPPPYRPWSPLIVVTNRKSGNNEGELILKAFRSFLNPAQVIDLHDLLPENGLEWCHLVPRHICRILVAGGDGTVGWVLNSIDKLKIKPQPQVCILPLGTGNDLSRVLGWGTGYSGEIDVKKILDQMATAIITRLDRWKMKITPAKHLGIRLPSKGLFYPKPDASERTIICDSDKRYKKQGMNMYHDYFMNNYASVGVDALVTLNFHRTRESKFYLFSSRLLNKFLYLVYGTKDILERECKNLHQKMELYLDDVLVPLPEVEAVIVLNISSWGAGVKPWQMGAEEHEFGIQRHDDGLLEVIAVYSSFHIAQLQIGLSEPVRLGQAKHVKLRMFERLPIQVDGEPWDQAPADIDITFHSQATMLCSRRAL